MVFYIPLLLFFAGGELDFFHSIAAATVGCRVHNTLESRKLSYCRAIRVLEYVRVHSRRGLSQPARFKKLKLTLCRPTLRRWGPWLIK